MTTRSASDARRRWPVHLGWALTATALAAVTWWAASAVLNPSVTAAPLPPAPVYSVSAGQVGIEQVAQGRVSFPSDRSAVAGRSGVVTAVYLPPGGSINAGDPAIAIDEAPLIAAVGATPAYRDMGLGMHGADVAQLRLFLGLEAGDYFDWRTHSAVRAWQRGLGVPDDGIVHRGDIVFLPSLPARGFVPSEVGVGSLIDPSQEVVMVTGVPEIFIGVDAGGRFASGMRAHLDLPDGTRITGTLSGPSRRPDGLEYFQLVGEDGASPCDPVCADQFPVTSESAVAVTVEIVPVAEGTLIPDSALIVMPDGALAVRLAGGDLVPVKVIAQGEGASIVEGIDEGAEIELFAAQDAAG